MSLIKLLAKRMIYIGADHGGFALKEHLKKFLAGHGIAVKDVGAKALKADDDYPDYAKLVSVKVSAQPHQDVGILICRSGQGVCIAANKFKNVRAALVWNVKEAQMSRTDDMTNVLCLPSDYISEKLAEKIVQAWLSTEYSTEKRHERRVRKISALES
jgi:ribose 5-phosphate isomerase B